MGYSDWTTVCLGCPDPGSKSLQISGLSPSLGTRAHAWLRGGKQPTRAVSYPWHMPSNRNAAQADRGELAILRQIRARAGGSRFPGLQLGIGDDCALLRPQPGHEFAVTTDLTICGTHFRLDWHSPESAGHRALARGLSDLAAMGAKPVAAFLSLGLPREFANPTGPWSASWAGRFVDGLLNLARTYKTPLAGGDLSETPIPLADIVLIGSVPAGQALLRSTSRPGDLLYVTGWLGGGAAALPHFDRLSEPNQREKP